MFGGSGGPLSLESGCSRNQRQEIHCRYRLRTLDEAGESVGSALAGIVK